VDPRWLITIVDDYSRFVPGSERFNEGTTEKLSWLPDRAKYEYAKPREILTDHRQPILERTQRVVKHILGGIGEPTTLGKMERWFRTYDLEPARF
jgi:transposase InsO family protein